MIDTGCEWPSETNLTKQATHYGEKNYPMECLPPKRTPDFWASSDSKHVVEHIGNMATKYETNLTKQAEQSSI